MYLSSVCDLVERDTDEIIDTCNLIDDAFYYLTFNKNCSSCHRYKFVNGKKNKVDAYPPFLPEGEFYRKMNISFLQNTKYETKQVIMKMISKFTQLNYLNGLFWTMLLLGFAYVK